MSERRYPSWREIHALYSATEPRIGHNSQNRAIIIQTLGDLKAHQIDMWGHCIGCGGGRRLEMDELIERYGADFVYVGETAISKALVCAKCGRRGGSITISHQAAAVDWSSRQGTKGNKSEG